MDLSKPRSGWFWAGIILGIIITLELALIAIVERRVTLPQFFAGCLKFYGVIWVMLAGMRYVANSLRSPKK